MVVKNFRKKEVTYVWNQGRIMEEATLEVHCRFYYNLVNASLGYYVNEHQSMYLHKLRWYTSVT